MINNSPIPKGWEIKKLSDIGKIYNGNSINAKVKKEKYTNLTDGLPYIATKDVNYNSVVNYDNGIKIPFKEKSLFKVASKDTILICAEGGSAGRKIGFINQEVCFGNKLFALSANNNINSKFIYYFYFSSSFQEKFANQLTGIIGGVSMNKFKQLEIPLPPLSEQQRIIAILDKAFAAISNAKDNAEQNLKNAKELFESYLQNIFENKGKDWEEKKLGEVLIMPPRNGWSPPAKYQSDYGTPVLTLSSITGFIFKPLSLKYTSAVSNPNAHYWINNGDLLITRSNTPELVGHVAICSKINTPTIYPDLIMKINPDNKIIMTKFLYYQLRSPLLRQNIMEAAHGANPTMKKINKKNVESLKVSYPVLNMQQAIVKKLDGLLAETKKMEAIYQQKQDDLEELKKSILQKAFEGEL